MKTFSLTCGIALVALGAGPAWGAEPVVFEDRAEAMGLTRAMKGMMSHAAACGDFDGDGDLDLYVGMFCDRPAEEYKGRKPGPVPNVLLVNDAGVFRDSNQQAVVFQARSSGAAFVDLDNDGDLDLYVANNSKSKGLRVANRLFENVGGRFKDISADNAACIVMGGRSVGVMDFDGDGRLDLLVAGDSWTGGHTKLFRNKGSLAFEDATAAAGLPDALPGLGVLTPDFNGDGRPDILIAQANRLFLSQGGGKYREAAAASKALQYPPINGEATPCGVTAADFDRDGDLDLVIVDHSQPGRTHLFLNEGLRDGEPVFREATAEAGLVYSFPSWTPQRFHLKHAHVVAGDFDNDGWPDIMVAATWRDGQSDQPFLCRNLGMPGGKCRFAVPPIDKANAYFASGPVADFDGDGRLDMFFAAWVPALPSPLFMNRGPKRHWLAVRVVGRSVNRMGIGSRVSLYAAGKSPQPAALLGVGEIGISDGFCTGHEATVHFGLGDATACDVEVTLPHGKGTLRRPNTPADQVLTIAEP